jgi:hypothetical protein
LLDAGTGSNAELVDDTLGAHASAKCRQYAAFFGANLKIRMNACGMFGLLENIANMQGVSQMPLELNLNYNKTRVH